MKKIFITVILVVALFFDGFCQQPLSPTRHGKMKSILNPAASLLSSEGEIAFLGRRQWVGIDGAPTVFWGSGHFGINSIKASLGVNLKHEKVGPEKLTEISAFFAKSIRLSEKEYLGLSLNAGISHLAGNFSYLDPLDPAFQDDLRETDGLIGVSFMVYRPNVYYAGISMPRYSLRNIGEDQINTYQSQNEFHLIVGGLIPIGSDFHVKPSLLITYAKNLKTQGDLSAMIYAKRIIGLGVNVRNQGDLAGMIDFHIGGFNFGYSYQFNTRNDALNQRIENSTHEIGISYRFGEIKSLL